MRTQRVMSWSLSFKLTTSRFMIQEQYFDHFISLRCGVKSFYICFHSNNDCPIKNSNLSKQTNLNFSGDSDKWLQLNINDFRWWKIREILKLVLLHLQKLKPRQLSDDTRQSLKLSFEWIMFIWWRRMFPSLVIVASFSS